MNRTRVAETPLLVPPQALRAQFSEIVRPDKALVSVLLKQCNALRASRDLLLPKLVSGELDVSTAEAQATKKAVTHAEVCRLHLLIAGDVMDQGKAGVYRDVEVRVGQYLPPKAREVKGLMTELLDWWNKRSAELSPVLTQGIIHYRFEAIHPFADGNGRTGRALAIWELYRRGFDSHHIFSVDEHYWEDRPRYYRELQAIREAGEDLTGFLEYCAEGLHQTLERAWRRVQQFSATKGKTKLVLRPKQEQVLFLLKANGSMTPRQIWDALGVSKQGALDTLKPLIKAGLIKRIGTQKNGRYVLE